MLRNIYSAIDSYNGHFFEHPKGVNQIVSYFYTYGMCDNFFDTLMYNPILVASSFKEIKIAVEENFSMKTCLDKIDYPKIDPIQKSHDP